MILRHLLQQVQLREFGRSRAGQLQSDDFQPRRTGLVLVGVRRQRRRRRAPNACAEILNPGREHLRHFRSGHAEAIFQDELLQVRQERVRLTHLGTVHEARHDVVCGA